MSNIEFDHGFHFSTENGYTGVTATSLPDFADKLRTIDVNSVVFHFSRGDFQRWIEDTLGDKKLANKIRSIKKDVSGEKLRKQILDIVQNRLKELERRR